MTASEKMVSKNKKLFLKKRRRISKNVSFLVFGGILNIWKKILLIETLYL